MHQAWASVKFQAFFLSLKVWCVHPCLTGKYTQQKRKDSFSGDSLLAVCVFVSQGAGGLATDWRGQALKWVPSGDAVDRYPGEVLAAGDATVHAQALQLLDWQPL